MSKTADQQAKDFWEWMGDGKPAPTQVEMDSDEWFVNNLIGLASASLAVAKKKGTRVNRHELAQWAFNHATKG